jgi:hypothetical protein
MRDNRIIERRYIVGNMPSWMWVVVAIILILVLLYLVGIRVHIS